jgi:hypothetical protein
MPEQTLRFVVQQHIEGTHTYRVISPTRSNFSAVNIFTRDDLWAPITAKAMQENVEKIEAGKNEQARQKAIFDKAKQDEENRKTLVSDEETVKELNEIFDKQNVNDQQQTDITIANEAEKLINATSPPAIADPGKGIQEKAVKQLVSELDKKDKVGTWQSAIEKQKQTIESATPQPSWKEALLKQQKVISGQEKSSTELSALEKSYAPVKSQYKSIETSLQKEGVSLKNEGVNVEGLTKPALHAAVVSSLTFKEYDKSAVITSAYDSFEEHGLRSKHKTGNAIDLRTQNLGLSYDEKLAIVEATNRRLNIGGGNDYTVLFEGAGTKKEHIHIQYNPITPEAQQRNRDILFAK